MRRWLISYGSARPRAAPHRRRAGGLPRARAHRERLLPCLRRVTRHRRPDETVHRQPPASHRRTLAAIAAPAPRRSHPVRRRGTGTRHRPRNRRRRPADQPGPSSRCSRDVEVVVTCSWSARYGCGTAVRWQQVETSAGACICTASCQKTSPSAVSPAGTARARPGRSRLPERRAGQPAHPGTGHECVKPGGVTQETYRCQRAPAEQRPRYRRAAPAPPQRVASM